jgi:hypothetical protein
MALMGMALMGMALMGMALMGMALMGMALMGMALRLTTNLRLGRRLFGQEFLAGYLPGSPFRGHGTN